MSGDGGRSSNAAGRRSTIHDTRISGGSPESIRCQRPATASRSSAVRPSTTTGVSAPTVTSSPARVRHVRSSTQPQYGSSWASGPASPVTLRSSR